MFPDVMEWAVGEARKVLLSEVSYKRKQQAYAFGATEVIDPLQKVETNSTVSDPVAAKKREISTSGQGFDVLIEESGLQTTLNTVIAAIRPSGTILNVVIYAKPLALNPNDLGFAEKRSMGGLGYTKEDFDAVRAALGDGSLQLEEMITSVVAIDDVVQGAFRTILDKKEDHITILIEVKPEGCSEKHSQGKQKQE